MYLLSLMQYAENPILRLELEFKNNFKNMQRFTAQNLMRAIMNYLIKNKTTKWRRDKRNHYKAVKNLILIFN